MNRGCSCRVRSRHRGLGSLRPCSQLGRLAAKRHTLWPPLRQPTPPPTLSASDHPYSARYHRAKRRFGYRKVSYVTLIASEQQVDRGHPASPIGTAMQYLINQRRHARDCVLGWQLVVRRAMNCCHYLSPDVTRSRPVSPLSIARHAFALASHSGRCAAKNCFCCAMLTMLFWIACMSAP